MNCEEVYPEMERRLSDLMGRVAASDTVLKQVNRNLPSGGEWLASAEEVARGGREKFGGTGSIWISGSLAGCGCRALR